MSSNLVSDSIKELILLALNILPGQRETELHLNVMRLKGPHTFVYHEFTTELALHVLEGRVLKVSYLCLHVDTRASAVYFPAGTTIRTGE